jgi:heme A synthase
MSSHRGLFSWWWVWIPVIVVVTLWLGGWGFGNYGGPWGPKPQNTEPQISDPAVAVLNFNY